MILLWQRKNRIVRWEKDRKNYPRNTKRAGKWAWFWFRCSAVVWLEYDQRFDLGFIQETPKELPTDFDFSSDIGLLCGLEMTSSTSELTKKNQNWWNWAGFRFWCWAVVWLLAITSKHLRIIHKTSKKELDFASDVGLFDLKHLPEDNPMNYHQRSSSSDLPRRFPGQPNLYHDNR